MHTELLHSMPATHVGASTFAALRTSPAGLLLPLLLLPALLLLPDCACAAVDRLLLLLATGCWEGHRATAGPA
jgi:hypothetical protein